MAVSSSSSSGRARVFDQGVVQVRHRNYTCPRYALPCFPTHSQSMFASVPKPRASGVAMHTRGSTAVAASGRRTEDRRSTLETLAALFSSREVRPPAPEMALTPSPVNRSSFTNQTSLGGGDYVVDTLASAAHSVLRETPGSTSSLLPEVHPFADASTLPSKSIRGPSSPSSSSKQLHGVFAVNPRVTCSVEPVTRVLGVLRAILQRSPTAHRHSRNYTSLLRLLTDGSFVETAAEQMRTLWSLCECCSLLAPTWQMEHRALSLYCDVLLLLAYHTLAGNPSEATLSCPLRISEGALTKLYDLSREIWVGITKLGSPHITYLRRSVATLTSFCILNAAGLPGKALLHALEDLERGASQQANMAHMVFMAALSTACPGLTEDQQCRALEVVRKSTLYDAAADVVVSSDGTSSIMSHLVNWAHGRAMDCFLSTMSDISWCCCTSDALLHICRAISTYGTTWNRYSRSYVSLVGFLHRALARYQRSYALEETHASRLMEPSRGTTFFSVPSERMTFDGLCLARRPPAPTASSRVEFLMRRSILGSVEGVTEREKLLWLPQRAIGLDFSDALAEPGGDRNACDSPAAYLARCETAPNSPRCYLFYLSLLAYVTSALPPLLESLNELSLFLYLPASGVSTNASATTATVMTSRKEGDFCGTGEAHSITSKGDEACGSNPVLGQHLFAQCVELLRTTLPRALADNTNKPEGRQRRLFCDAAATLLSSFMCSFPHSLQTLEEETGTRGMVDVVSFVITTIVDSPRPSLRMRRIAYTLLYRYASAIDSIGLVMARLLNLPRWSAVVGDDDDADADFSTCVALYAHLCRSVHNAGPVDSARVVSLLAELPVGRFCSFCGGADTAAVLIHTVVELIDDQASDASLLGAITVAQVPMLVGRLGEALGVLVQAHAQGYLSAGDVSTWHAACAATSLLYRVVLLLRVPGVVATALLDDSSSTPAFNRNGTVAGAYGEVHRSHARCLTHLLLLLLGDDTFAPVHHVAAELLSAALHASALEPRETPMFQVFRSSISPQEAAELRLRLLKAQREGSGSSSNVLRLEVWQAMVSWCPPLFLFLFGPLKTDSDEEATARSSGGGLSDDDPDDKETTQPADLPLFQLLLTTVRSHDVAPYEKAVALNILRSSGMVTLVPPQAVLALAPSHDSGSDEIRSTVWEKAALTTACIAYINARLAHALMKAKMSVDLSSGGAVKAGDAETSDKGDLSRDVPADVTLFRTPSRRSLPTPWSPPGSSAAQPLQAARAKALAEHTDTMDQLLRQGTAALRSACDAYKLECAAVQYTDLPSWLLRQTTRMMAGEASGISGSVVFPHYWDQRDRKENALSTCSVTGGVESVVRDPSQMSALSRVSVPTVLTTVAGAQVSLCVLTRDEAELLVPFQRLFPIGMAPTRFFRRTDDDGRMSVLAALLDTMSNLSGALEHLLWCSGIDTNTVGLFEKRTQRVLECALNLAVSCPPTSPLLTPLLTSQVQQQLQLAKAATCVLESTHNGEAMGLEASPPIERALSLLAEFVKVNRRHTFLVVEALEIVKAFSCHTLTMCATTDMLLGCVLAVIHAHLQSQWTADVLKELDRIVDSCIALFTRPRSEGFRDVVLASRLLPCLAHIASRLAQFVQPALPSQANSLRFARVLECIGSILLHYGGQTAVLGFLSEDVLLGFLQALGQFASSSVYDAAAQRHVRLAWHTCWVALLSLWCTIISLGGLFNASSSGWVPPLKAALLSIPRFALALSAFADVRGVRPQALLFWEVEEMELGTRLAAVLAAQDITLESLTPCVQAGFIFAQQPHLLQRCQVSTLAREMTASEGRRSAAAQAHILRYQLTILLKLSAYAIPRDGSRVAAFVFSPELFGQYWEGDRLLKPQEGSSREFPTAAASLVHSLELLRQFTLRELQIVRRMTSVPVGVPGVVEQSPEGCRNSTVSHESSVTRSPSRGPPATDGDTMTELDDTFTLDGQNDAAADVQTVHLEIVQLALTAYVLTLQDLVRNSDRAPGVLYTANLMLSVRNSADRLLRTLRSLGKELRGTRWPLLGRIAQAKARQLQSLLDALQF